MKQVQFGVLEDSYSKKVEAIKLKLCIKKGGMVKSRDVLEFMILAADEKFERDSNDRS